MSKKQEKASKYASTKFVEKEKILGANFADYESIFNKKDIAKAFEVGWDEALESKWINTDEQLPDFDDVENISDKKKYLVRTMYIGTENEVGYAVSYMRSRYKFNVETDRVKVIAWMPIPSFDEILEANKDVLERLKGE